MSNKLIIDSGEFRAVLKNLPKDLTTEASDIVVNHAEKAGSQIASVYDRVHKTGNLRRGLKIQKAPAATFHAVAVVRSTSPHAWLYEHGTQGRIRYYKLASRGPMPGANVFVPAVIRERRAMVDDLVRMVERAGLTVTRG